MHRIYVNFLTSTCQLCLVQFPGLSNLTTPKKPSLFDCKIVLFNLVLPKYCHFQYQAGFTRAQFEVTARHALVQFGYHQFILAFSLEHFTFHQMYFKPYSAPLVPSSQKCTQPYCKLVYISKSTRCSSATQSTGKHKY